MVTFTFTLVDYAVLLLVLIVLSGIGLYYRYTGGRQSSTEEYILGDRNQRILPVALSLVASHNSGISILGVPSEVYYHGAINYVSYLSMILVIPITNHLFLPVFFKIGSCSVYEYLEQRFGKYLRTLASLTYPLHSLLVMAVVLYAPSLALETISGLSVFWSIIILGCVCTFYSTIGGIKAIIMTDVFQFVLTNLAVWSVIVVTYLEMGSFTRVWKTASEGGRINFSNFSLDPTERQTWWSLIIGGFFTNMGTFAVNQAQVQRYMTLRDHRTAMRTLYLTLPVTMVLALALNFAGLALYAHYHDCDPLQSGAISQQDQLLPHWVLDTLHSVPGLPALMVAGIFSASLSSISAFLNSLATVLLQDFIKPIYLSIYQTKLPEHHSLILTKFLGGLCVLVVILMACGAHMVGGILQTGLQLSGIVGGPVLAVFTLGIFVPSANEPGAVAALLSGMALFLWLSFGGPKPPIANLPVNTDHCVGNLTDSISPLLQQSSVTTNQLRPEEYWYLHRISYWWTVVLTYLLAMAVGCFVSLLTRSCNHHPDPGLFSPPVAALLRQREQKKHIWKKHSDTVQYSKNEDDVK